MATIWVAMSFSANTKADNGKLTINFKHYAGNELLKLDSSIYKNEAGQSFSVTNFKYYVGNFRLKRIDGTEYISSDYYLIKEDDEQSKQIVLNNIPEGEYVSCNFSIGVDSAHNCSGAQSGALDPANGMFWAWNTGYIFMKLEGKSPASKLAGHTFEFHIGGYKFPNNCIRNVNLETNKLIIAADNTASMEIKTDVLEIMKSPVTIDLSNLSSVTDFHNATTVADNYKDMFSILHINNEK
jgi:hypothetical protein